MHGVLIKGVIVTSGEVLYTFLHVHSLAGTLDIVLHVIKRGFPICGFSFVHFSNIGASKPSANQEG